MKTTHTSLALIAAVLCGGTLASYGGLFNHTDGNLVLGFQATGGTGASQNVFLSLGSATSFRDNGNQGTIANIGATLSAVYGADWYTRTDLHFGVVGNLSGKPTSGIGSASPVNGDPSRTFYISTPAASPGAGFLRAAGTFGSNSLGAAGTNFQGMEDMLRGATNGVIGGFQAEADGSGILDSTHNDHATAWANSWTTWNPTPGASFQIFTGGIQQSFGQGGSATYVDVQRILATNTGASPAGVIGGGTYETTIAISPTGAVSAMVSTPSSAFAAWVDSFNPPLANAADREPGADPDGDGFNNLMEFVLNGNPTASSTSIAPALNTSGAGFAFTFTRRDDSEAECGVVFQYGGDLTNWTNVPIGAADATVGDAVIDVTENDGSPDTITVTIPKGTHTRLFGRLVVTR